MTNREKITREIYRNSTDTSEGLLIRFDKISPTIDKLEALSIYDSSLKLPSFDETVSIKKDFTNKYKKRNEHSCRPSFDIGFMTCYFWLKDYVKSQ